MGSASYFLSVLPITAEEKAMKRVGKLMKKNNIALDIISIGENASNQAKLEGLLEAVNKNENSHYVEVSPGTISFRRNSSKCYCWWQ